MSDAEDLFGEQTPEEIEAERIAEEKRKKIAEEHKAKKKAAGKEVIAKTIFMFDVKVYE